MQKKEVGMTDLLYAIQKKGIDIEGIFQNYLGFQKKK